MIQMTTHTFVPDVRVVGRIEPVVAMETIIAEPMLWGASWEFSREHGGPLTQRVLDALEPELPEMQAIARPHGRYLNIDTESQDLIEGQYPSIPGWHCDAMSVRRPNDGEAEAQIARDTIVYTCFLSTEPQGVSQTLFAAEPLTLEVDTDHVWNSVHRGAERFLLHREKGRDGDVIRFDGNTLHRSSECHRTGWRYWFRLTIYPKPPKNIIKNRVQVYTPIESRG
jgi:hypothetical protein